VTMLVRCLAMMRGGGETRHLAWARELTALGVSVEMIAGRPLLFGGPRYPVDDFRVTLLRSSYNFTVCTFSPGSNVVFAM